MYTPLSDLLKNHITYVLLLEMVRCLVMFCVFVVTTHSTARSQIVVGENIAGFEDFRLC